MGRIKDAELDREARMARRRKVGTSALKGSPLLRRKAPPLTLDAAGLEARYNTTYAYDALGQLIRVDDEREGATWTYRYDQGGNILEKKRYGYTLAVDLDGLTPEQVIPYAYGDTNWKDRLTAYDGKPITYDAIGNPLTYDGWTFTWKAGRMLHSMVQGDTTAQFTYDHTGLRVKKSVNGVDTLYTLNGKWITHMRKGPIQMHFFYDAQGRPAMVRYNDADYAYLQNLQGDVTGIVDMNGAIVVEYGYDAWGKPTSTEGIMASTLGHDNPFRYRGYVYDEETGLYLTITRYYDPEWGRWLNADTLLGKTGAVLSHNLFAYCINNPANMIDSTGLEPIAWSGVQSLGWKDVYYGPINGGKRGIPGEGVIIDMGTELSFEMSWSQIRDDGYHIDCRFKEGTQEAGVALFAGLLKIKPNSKHATWDNAGGWIGRPAILIMYGEDQTIATAGTLVPFPHSGSPGKFNKKGHFDFYLKDSGGNDRINKTTGNSYAKDYHAVAIQAHALARAKARKVPRVTRRPYALSY